MYVNISDTHATTPADRQVDSDQNRISNNEFHSTTGSV